MIEEGCEQPNGNDDMEDILRILSMKISVLVFYYRTRGFPHPKFIHELLKKVPKLLKERESMASTF